MLLIPIISEILDCHPLQKAWIWVQVSYWGHWHLPYHLLLNSLHISYTQCTYINTAIQFWFILLHDWAETAAAMHPLGQELSSALTSVNVASISFSNQKKLQPFFNALTVDHMLSKVSTFYDTYASNPKVLGDIFPFFFVLWNQQSPKKKRHINQPIDKMTEENVCTFCSKWSVVIIVARELPVRQLMD